MCVHAIGMRFCPIQEYFQPVIIIPSIVSQQLRWLAVVVYENVEIAVVVEVADGGATAHAWQLKIRTKSVADVFENSVPGIAEHLFGFGIMGVGVVALDVVEDVAS